MYFSISIYYIFCWPSLVLTPRPDPWLDPWIQYQVKFCFITVDHTINEYCSFRTRKEKNKKTFRPSLKEYYYTWLKKILLTWIPPCIHLNKKMPPPSTHWYFKSVLTFNVFIYMFQTLCDTLYFCIISRIIFMEYLTYYSKEPKCFVFLAFVIHCKS